MSKPLKTPIPEPSASAFPIPASALDEEQSSKLDSLLKITKSWKNIPSKSGKDGPITEDEIFWLTRECLLRYLRATKWNIAESAKRLLGTLSWRRDFGVDNLNGDTISKENETGKQVLLGYDNQKRPCLYMLPKRQNTTAGPTQVEHVVFMIERGIELMGPGQEKLLIMIDFKIELNKIPGVGIAKLILDIIQTHYPERLGSAFVVNAPWALGAFFKVMSPFMDPLTRQKLNFGGDLRKAVPPEQLCKEFKGDLDFEYDHKIYWPALLQMCEERKRLQRERWVASGKKYGESEAYLRSGSHVDVSQ